MCTSTAESEYVALGNALKALMPLIELVTECCKKVGLSSDVKATIQAEIFEDNNACLILATSQKLTSRTRWFHQKWHWFWSIVRTDPRIKLLKIESANQWADYLTKPLSRETFEKIRKLVQKW